MPLVKIILTKENFKKTKKQKKNITFSINFLEYKP